MRGLNLALRLLLELAMLAGLAYWGFWVGDNLVLNVALGLGAPLLAATVWGLFIAPKARRRVADPLKVALEVDLFTLAIVAVAFSVSIPLAIVFAVAVAVNLTLMFVWDQRDH